VRQREAYLNPRGRATRLIANTHKRARLRGEVSTVTLDRVLGALNEGACEVTGIPFDYESRQFAPSLDRRDNAMGYTDDNIQVVVWIYNAAKGVGTHADILRLAEAIRE
jgi:hypothetical protein